MERVLLTAEEVAEALHIGRCTVYDLIRTGQLQSFKIGKLRRIPVDAVHDYARRMLAEARRRRMSRNANGEGSIWQRKDGRWCAAAYLPVATGGRRRVVAYGHNRQEASAKLRELLDRAERNIPATPANLTVADYLHRVARPHPPPRPTQHLRRLREQRPAAPDPADRQEEARPAAVRDVRLMVDAMRADGKNPRSIQYVHATLRAALEHACREEIVPRNVARLVRIQAPDATQAP